MSALVAFIKEIDSVRRMKSRDSYPSIPLALDGWERIAREARIALAALRKIKRIGSNRNSSWTEEGEIAATALKRIAGKPKRRGK